MMTLNENLFLEYIDEDEVQYDHDEWRKVDSKEVKDSDGFMTDYTWYTNSKEDRHLFIFGDSDIYGPDDSYADAEFDSYDSAKEWFDNYYGFDYDEEDPDFIEFAEKRPVIEESTESEDDDKMVKLAKKHGLDILSPMSSDPGSMRVSGTVRDLDNFYKEAEELGLLECLHKDLDETLTMHNFDEFKAIADEVGLFTAKDLETFRREEVQPGEDELTAIKRYKQELIDAGVDLSKLVKESLQEGAVKEVAIDIESKEKELMDLETSLTQLKSYDKKECGAGGQFDSVKELEDEIDSTEADIDRVKKEIEELKAKVNS